MTSHEIINVNVISTELIPTPRAIKEKLPLSAEGADSVNCSRRELEAILDGRDKRLFLVVGPCSVHDLAAAREYSEKLKTVADRVKDTFLVLMRVYFAKPRKFKRPDNSCLLVVLLAFQEF